MKIWILTAIFLSIQLVSFAHEDTPIKLTKEGKLIGLPEKYANPQFDYSSFTLRINDKQIIIPDCVKEYFKNLKDYKINFAASWYHDYSLLPPYIHLDISTSENPYGCQIFFKLETLEIFLITKPEIETKKNAPHVFLINEQEISEKCKEAILNSISKI